MGAPQGVPRKVVAQLMGHTDANVTRNIYTQVLDASLPTAADQVGGIDHRLFTNCEGVGANFLNDWLAALDDFRNWLIRSAA